METGQGLLSKKALGTVMESTQEPAPQTERQPSQVTIEMAKKGYATLEREKGPKALAEALGVWWFQANHYSFPEEQAAAASFLPKVLKDPAITEIFHTAYQYRAEAQRAFDELFNSPHPLSEQEREERFQKWIVTEKRLDAYWKRFNNSGQSDAATQAQERYSSPVTCGEGLRYKRRQEKIPSDHLRECAICSSH